MRNLFHGRTTLFYMTVITAAASLLAVSLTYVIDDGTFVGVFAQTQEQNQSSQLQGANITGDLTQASSGNSYGGEKAGEISINSDGYQVDIKGIISASPGEGNVYEAWLQDAGGSEYRLSLGQVMENGTIDFNQDMVNPFTYTIFFITEEPADDTDPNPATAIAGIELDAPFGQ